MVGDINIENGFEGTIEWLDPYGRCKITWDQVSGSEIEPCDICDSSWSFQLTHGRPETQLASCLETQTFMETTEIQIGFNHAVSWDDMDFENTMLFNHPDAGWIPYGDGEIEQEDCPFLYMFNSVESQLLTNYTKEPIVGGVDDSKCSRHTLIGRWNHFPRTRIWCHNSKSW